MLEGPSDVRVVGRYAVHGVLATGGMASVHLGRLLGPVGFSRMVAIKRMHRQYAQDPDFVEMFVDEARLAGRIRHPNVVPVIDVVAAQGEVLLVMEYVAGETLGRLMQLVHAGKGRIPTRIGAGIMRDALTGLHAAHEVTDERGVMLNLVHRDVSPQNILVGADGVARVLDFGIAKASSRSQKTRDGQVKGKLSYMAPEQLGGEATRVSDVFAACIVLWEVLTGERLFRGATEQETVMRVIAAPIARPSERAPELGTVFDEIVMKGLERDPARRFQTAREVAVALDDVAELADAGEIAEWVGGIARELLAERARTVIDVETTAPHEVKSTPPRAPQPPVVSAEPTKTVLTSVVVGQPQPRSWLGVAAGGVLLVGVAVMGTILATRHDGPAAGASAVVDPSSQPSAIPPPTPSASSIAVATALSPTASTSATAAPGPSAPHPRGHVKPPRASSPTIPDHL